MEEQTKSTASQARVVTKRNGAMHMLPESDDRYLALFERSMDAVYIHDVKGHFLAATAVALRLPSHSRADLVGLS